MTERMGNLDGEGRSYAADDERRRAGSASDSVRTVDEESWRQLDREVWSSAAEPMITDADVEAGESRRAEQFED